MVTVTIRGKEYPLCLTVAALEKITEKGIGLNDLADFLVGGGETGKSLTNCAWLLGLLMQEGEENRLMCAELDGQESTRNKVPGYNILRHALNPGEVRQYQELLFKAVSESMKTTIEAAPPKNADHAERG